MKDFGTSLSPKSTRLRDSCYCPGRSASVPLRHTIASSVQAPQHSRNGLTACRMRVHMASAGYGTTCGPCATPAIRTRLRLPGTTRLVLRTSMAGSGRVSATKSPVRKGSSQGRVHKANSLGKAEDTRTTLRLVR